MEDFTQKASKQSFGRDDPGPIETGTVMQGTLIKKFKKFFAKNQEQKAHPPQAMSPLPPWFNQPTAAEKAKEMEEQKAEMERTVRLMQRQLAKPAGVPSR